MAYPSYELESIALVTKFAHYAQARKLPPGLFDRPDHIALHATDISDFDQRVKEVDPFAERLIVRESNDRFIVAAQLSGALSVAELGRVRWLEIIEPIYEEAEVGLISGDHIEFFNPEFNVVRSALDKKNVFYKIDDYPEPRIKVPYNDAGDEFRFARRPLQAILALDVAAHEAKVIKETL